MVEEGGEPGQVAEELPCLASLEQVVAEPCGSAWTWRSEPLQVQEGLQEGLEMESGGDVREPPPQCCHL